LWADCLECGVVELIAELFNFGRNARRPAAMETSGGMTDDTLSGSQDDDVIHGGDGNDFLSGNGGADLLNGNAGADTLSGGEGNDEVRGGNGADAINGDGGDDVLVGAIGNDVLKGGDGADTLLAGQGDDSLEGGVGRDWLVGGNGADLIQGGTGADTLWGGEGNDELRGGNAADILDGEVGEDSLYGGFGNDALNGGNGADFLLAGEGNDSLSGGDDDDYLIGGNGADLLNGNAGSDTLEGGEGDDELRGGNSGDLLKGDVGDDALFGALGDDEMAGGEGDDMLLAGQGNDTLDGGTGNDLLAGLLNDDSLAGGEGNDTLNGGGGDDTLDGGEGVDIVDYRDVSADLIVHLDEGLVVLEVFGTDQLLSIEGILGGAGNDILVADSIIGSHFTGNAGNDVLYGQSGNDTLLGGSGLDTVLGGAGDDVLDGGDAADRLSAGQGDDSVAGGSDDDSVQGDEGDDFLFGGDGADWLDGGSENDVLYGEVGNDTLVGGAGDDSLDGGEEGMDSLQGASGNDTLVGGWLLDWLAGGNGDDLYIIDAISLPATVLSLHGNGFMLNGSLTLTAGSFTDFSQDLDNDGLVDRLRVFYTDPAHHWDVIIGTFELGTNIVPGLYENATSQFVIGLPELEVTGDGHGDEAVASSFTVLNAEFDYSGSEPEPVSISIQFEWRPENLPQALFGTLNINSPGGLQPDAVYEMPFGGDDTVQTAFSYSLPGNVEHLILTGSEAIDGSGNGLANTLIGNAGNNVLEGHGGNDTLTGGQGSDRIVFAETLGSENVDTITDFEFGVDVIELNPSAFGALLPLADGVLPTSNFVVGSAALESNDYIIYDDTVGALYYDADGSGEREAIVFATVPVGTVLVAADIVVSKPPPTAHLSDTINGGLGIDTVLGLDGADTLQGTAQLVDVLAGGPGNDLYVITDSVAPPEFVVVMEGNDFILHGERFLTSDSFDFTVFASDATGDGLVDNLHIKAIGEEAIGGEAIVWDFSFSTYGLGQNLVPGFYDDTVRIPISAPGHPGLDVSGEGRGANETAGNFTVVVADFDYSGSTPTVETLSIEFEQNGDGSPGVVIGTLNINYPGTPVPDYVIEAEGEGDDTVQSAVTFVLPGNVEHLVLTGSDSIKGTGNELANSISGNGSANTLAGLAGDDTLHGGGGSDIFVYSATSLAEGDVRAGDADAIGDISAGDSIDITASLAALLEVGGAPLASGVLPGTLIAGSTNVAFNNATDLLVVDIDGDGIFNPAQDFSIGLPGISAVTYVAATSSFIAI
jgi:Ca2+-binding RTX toxin-like protein